MQHAKRRRWIGMLSLGLIAVTAIVVVLAVFADTNDTSFTATGYSDVIRFQAEGVATLQVRVFDLSGREIWDSGVVSGDIIDWDRRNDTGERLAYGAYIYSAQGWNASGGLNFQKNGKLALMPGDTVQLQAAPTMVEESTLPLPTLETSIQPKDVINDNLLVNGTISAVASGSGLGFLSVEAGSSGPTAMFRLTGHNPSNNGDYFVFSMATDIPDTRCYVKDVSTATFHDLYRFQYLNNAVDWRGNSMVGMGNVGIGTTTPLSTLSVAGTVRTTYADYVPDFRSGTGDLDLWGAQDVYIVPASGYATYVREDLYLYDTSECYFAMDCIAGSGRTWGFESSDDGYFEIWDWDYGNYVAWFSPSSHSFWVRGNLLCSGTKSFVIPHPDQPGKEIVYTTLEGPEVGIYVRGTTTLFGGQAIISIPEHFGAIVVEDSITVQLTPRGTWLELYVVSATANQVVVGEATGQSGSFDYLIQGIRQGYEDFEPVQDASEVTSRQDAGASIPLPPSADKPANTATDEKVD